MWFWDKHDLPFTYSLARHFPIGQRYFCSTLCQTYPNRRFLFAGHRVGPIDDKNVTHEPAPAANGTIFDRLDAHGISWAGYYQDLRERVASCRASRPRHAGAGSTSSTSSPPTWPPASCRRSRPRPELQLHLRGEPAGRRGRRGVRRAGRPRADAGSDVEEHGPVPHLRRARRVLRPRPAAAGDQAGQHRADARSPATSPGAYDRYGFRVPLIVDIPVRARRLRLERRPGPHVDHSPSSSASGTSRR